MKTIVITGATAGIGLHSAEQLGAQGHHLVLVGRSEAKLGAAAARVRAAGAVHVDTVVADFQSLSAVDAAAHVILDGYDRLDVLINNAGGLFRHRTLTQDGYEATFGVNHLAGYLLTERLKPLLIHTAPARVVITASSGHSHGSIDFDDLHFEHRYDGFRAYYRSKLANVLYTRALATELTGKGVTVNALHPGMVATDIWDSTPALARPLVAAVKRVAMLTPAQGGARITHVAVEPRLETVTGAYFSRNRVKQPSKLARDAALGTRLCRVSDQLTGMDRNPLR
ncbi:MULTISPECIES: SDR family NAD(P)-dependent oxidoreductase [unclassified Mycobacterium]|uniref:SDR family NAD(P)-dependent oxidoreductase n=1 Tax=unclassified Mycobacterium TaxID=2642494 RepID=UPI00080175E2|nr:MULTISPECIES: SDR family NAD(P)-dependent oxidoreductase [unclassified Mycobacterium]OBI13678.1 hypothetical protein A5713_26465 [Mycobacterium sp. E2497]